MLILSDHSLFVQIQCNLLVKSSCFKSSCNTNLKNVNLNINVKNVVKFKLRKIFFLLKNLHGYIDVKRHTLRQIES